MSARVKCKMCGERCDGSRVVYAAPSTATGEPLPGARTKAWKVCESCYSLIADGDA